MLEELGVARKLAHSARRVVGHVELVGHGAHVLVPKRLEHRLAPGHDAYFPHFSAFNGHYTTRDIGLANIAFGRL